MSEADRRHRRGPGGPLRRLVKFLLRYAGAGLFLFLSFWVGLFWFVALAILFFFGISLVPILVGIPILALTALVWTFAARLERWRVRLLLGVRIPSPYRRAPEGSSRLVWLRTRLLDPALWRDLVYVLLLFPIGIVQLVVVLLAISIPLDMITYPLWFEPLKGGERISEFGVQLGNSISSSETPETIIQVGPYAMDTTPEILLTVFVGLLLVVAGLFLIRLSARMHAAFAMTLLGPDPLRFPRLTRRFALISVSAALVVLATFAFFKGDVVVDQAAAVWGFISSPDRVRVFFEGFGMWGPALFFGLQAAQVVVALIPAGPIMLAGVATFGAWWGFALSLFGAVLGSVVAFFMGRRFGRPMVSKLVGEKVLDKYSDKMGADGWWMLVALMLPIPAGGDAVCSLAGLSEISTARFVILNVVGRIPYTALAVLAASGLATGSTGLLIGAAVVLALLGVTAFFYVRREKRLGKQRDEQQPGSVPE